MRTPSRILSALFGVTLAVALSGVAGAQPDDPAVDPTPISESSVPESSVPESVPASSAPATTTPASSTPVTTTPVTTTSPPDVGIETGTVAARAATLAEDAPVANVSVSLARCATGEAAGTVITGADGLASLEVSLGCYTVTAAGFPHGYEPASIGPWQVHLDAPGQVQHVGFVFARTPPPAPEPTVNGRLVKMDRISGDLLPGAIFDIGPCQSEWTHRVVTEHDGQVPLTLAPGCYVARELDAPAGYILDPRPITFTATDGEYFTVQAFNLPADRAPVFRNPDVRVPVRSIPTGPTER